MQGIAKALKLTAKEKKEFSKAAKEAGMSLGELIRMLLKGYVDGKRILQ